MCFFALMSGVYKETRRFVSLLMLDFQVAVSLEPKSLFLVKFNKSVTFYQIKMDSNCRQVWLFWC